MIWIILGVIVGIIIGVRAYHAWGGLISGVTAFALVVAVVFAAGNVGCKLIYTETSIGSVAVETQELATFQDNSSIHGEAFRFFYLGYGYIEEKEYYVYYYKSNYGYKYEKIEVNSPNQPVYINYISEGESPRIERYSIVEQQTLKKKPNKWFWLSGYLNYKDYNVGDVIYYGEPETIERNNSKGNYYENFRYEIFIPEVSIQENFTIDLQ